MFARSAEALLTYLGTSVLGFYAIWLGIKVMFTERVSLTRSRVLKGWTAILAGLICILAGSGFIWLVIHHARYFPE
jgi:hypothetical protein